MAWRVETCFVPQQLGLVMTLTYTHTDHIAPEVVKLLSDGLTVHAAEMGFPTQWKEYAILARNAAGEVVAGVCGNSGQGAIFIRLLWVHSDHRKQGLGKSLLAMAEAEGLKRGCHTAFLDTFAFQGPDYYPKFGYKQFGQLDGLGPNRDLTRTWFAKRIA
jgi:GNAT superfamily N-acetyltransferase